MHMFFGFYSDYKRFGNDKIGHLAKSRQMFFEKHIMLDGENTYRSAISIKLQSNFIEITLWRGCSPVILVQNTFS